MKPFVAAFCLMFAVGSLRAQVPAWEPSPGHKQIPLWPGKIPDAQHVAEPENDTKTVTDSLVANKPWVEVGKVSRPTITVYSPQGKNTGAAVLVFPGGGYWILAIDLEGTEVCDWLTSKGITCVLLKYRVPGEGLSPRSGPYPKSPMALEDAQRALGLVRFHASEWHIDLHKIGVLGFSAGGHLVAARDAFVCSRRTCVRAAAHEASGYDMASASGDVAAHHWNDSRVIRPQIVQYERDLTISDAGSLPGLTRGKSA